MMKEDRGIEQGAVLNLFLNPQQKETKRLIEQVMGKPDEEVAEESLLQTVVTGKLLELQFVGESPNQLLISQELRNLMLN